MNNIIHRISGVISIFCYIFLTYQLWHLCQYGGAGSHFPVLIALFILLMAGIILGLITGRRIAKDMKKESPRKRKHAGMIIGLLVIVSVTVYFSVRIIYSALPYNGALSWKIDEWRNRKKVELTHNNFFTGGAEGVLEDLDKALDLPEELYILNKFQMTFDGCGLIRTIDTLLYGIDSRGEIRTYLVAYNADDGSDMTVWKDGYANADYDENMKLSPMLRILEKAPCEEQAAAWEEMKDGQIYEILYMGKRSFQTENGLEILPGDVNGDGQENKSFVPGMLASGGEVTGYEVSLHIPGSEEITPVRYMMEPEYVSLEQISDEQEQKQTETAKETDGWTVDSADGSMRYFLDEMHGWKLVVEDAAAGSRFYGLSRTEDGGTIWETVNPDPFAGNLGVAEGLRFYDENFGFAALSGASQSYSRMYMTKDGGSTFSEILLPMDEVTQLPEHAEQYGNTLEDYAYLCMPEKEGDSFIIDILSAAGEAEGIRFRSEDGGISWTYVGCFQD